VGKQLKPCGGFIVGRLSSGTVLLDAFLNKYLVTQAWAVLSWRLAGYLIILQVKTNFRVAVIVFSHRTRLPPDCCPFGPYSCLH